MSHSDLEQMRLKLYAFQIHMGWLMMHLLAMGTGHIFREGWNDGAEERLERLRAIGEYERGLDDDA